MLPDHPTPIPLTLTFATTLLGVLCLGSAASTAEPQCVASFREIKFPDGSARVKNYVCKTEGSSKPDIRVEFDRLSEAAAGSLIQGEAYPDMETAFGKVRVVNNAVTAETKKLFDEFGTKSVAEDCHSFSVSTADGGKEYHAQPPVEMLDTGECSGETRTLWYLTYPQRVYFAMEIPLPADSKRYQNTVYWPNGYAFNYGLLNNCWKHSPIACTVIWRGARQEDLANYWTNKAAEERELNLPPDDAQSSESQGEKSESNPEEEFQHRYFSLVDYLTRSGWPDDFLIITGQVDLCAGGLSSLYFQLHIRQLIVDVAFVQNLSDKPVSIEALLGTETGGNQLRKTVSGQTSSPDMIALATDQLQPSETIAFPLRISFVLPGRFQDQFSDSSTAEKTFKTIRAAKPGTIFEMAAEEGDAAIRKLRESFGAPTLPKPTTYAFGPEIKLDGLVLDGKSVVFDQASRNFMELTAGSGYGSCPYLYAWDDGHNAWVRHGKMIDKANSKDMEMTETKTFPGFRSKFRLAEEELEVSYIDHVKLEVELNDGTGMTLKPDFAALAEQDAHYATIKAGDRIEFSFALPAIVKAEDVKQSTLAVTGYYRRYSDLLMAKR